MKQPHRIRRWLVRAIIAVFVCVIMLLVAIVSGGGVASGERADCIVVPGAAVLRGREPSDALRYRLEGALRLYNEGRAPRIIVTGGGAGDYAEGGVMAQWLIERGVPATAVVRETQAATTRENGINTARLMKANGLKSALVCSQWFHVARARLCLEQEGIDTYPAPCGGNTLVKEPLFVLREMVALPVYALRVDELR